MMHFKRLHRTPLQIIFRSQGHQSADGHSFSSGTPGPDHILKKVYRLHLLLAILILLVSLGELKAQAPLRKVVPDTMIRFNARLWHGIDKSCLKDNSSGWYILNSYDYLIMGSEFISGFADGTNQAIIHHGLGKGYSFWDYETSWKRKYRDYDNGDTRAAFFGSKTFLVGFTDGFHLTRMVDRSFSLATVGITASELKRYEKCDRWKVVAKKVLISLAANRAAFYLSYDLIF